MKKRLFILCMIALLAFSFIGVSCADSPNSEVPAEPETPTGPSIPNESEWKDISVEEESLLKLMVEGYMNNERKNVTFSSTTNAKIALENNTVEGITLSGTIDVAIIAGSNTEYTAKGTLEKDGEPYVVVDGTIVETIEFIEDPETGMPSEQKKYEYKDDGRFKINNEEKSAEWAYQYIMSLAKNQSFISNSVYTSVEKYAETPFESYHETSTEPVTTFIVTGSKKTTTEGTSTESKTKGEVNYTKVLVDEKEHTMTYEIEYIQKVIEGKYETTYFEINYISLDGKYFKIKDSFKNWF